MDYETAAGKTEIPADTFRILSTKSWVVVLIVGMLSNSNIRLAKLFITRSDIVIINIIKLKYNFNY